MAGNSKASWESFETMFNVVVLFVRKRGYTAQQISRVQRRTGYNIHCIVARLQPPPPLSPFPVFIRTDMDASVKRAVDKSLPRNAVQ